METNNPKEPLACSLTKTEMKERMKILEKFKGSINKKKEIENGIVFQLEGNDQNLDEVIALIKLERLCCPFLTFDLVVQKGDVPIQLSVTGPEGTTGFLVHELGL